MDKRRNLTISARCVGKNLWIATEGINLCLSISIRCCNECLDKIFRCCSILVGSEILARGKRGDPLFLPFVMKPCIAFYGEPLGCPHPLLPSNKSCMKGRSEVINKIW